MRPINEMVDQLRDDSPGSMPHVAPLHGGIQAQVLSVLRDPGPATRAGVGSGFLCIENNDATAERQMEMFAAVGIKASDIMPWNAYPWYINAAPRPAQLDQGVQPLARLIDLMPDLRVVLLQGNDARNRWSRLLNRFPGRARRATIVSTFHPGRQDARVAHRERAYRDVAAALGR